MGQLRETCQQEAKEGRWFVPLKACKTDNMHNLGIVNLAGGILLPTSLPPHLLRPDTCLSRPQFPMFWPCELLTVCAGPRLRGHQTSTASCLVTCPRCTLGWVWSSGEHSWVYLSSTVWFLPSQPLISHLTDNWPTLHPSFAPCTRSLAMERTPQWQAPHVGVWVEKANGPFAGLVTSNPSFQWNRRRLCSSSWSMIKKKMYLMVGHRCFGHYDTAVKTTFMTSAY